MTIPLLVRQIEGLKLLQKTRKPKQDDDKRVWPFEGVILQDLK